MDECSLGMDVLGRLPAGHLPSLPEPGVPRPLAVIPEVGHVTEAIEDLAVAFRIEFQESTWCDQRVGVSDAQRSVQTYSTNISTVHREEHTRGEDRIYEAGRIANQKMVRTTKIIGRTVGPVSFDAHWGYAARPFKELPHCRAA